MINYDYHNREERAICAHLFRLLHERLEDQSLSPLGIFLSKLSSSNLEFKNGKNPLTNLTFKNIAIYCEASLIRDAYQNIKPTINPFMDDLTRLIMKQECITTCRLYSQLPEPLNNSKLTHPKQIRQKAITEGIQLSEDESKIYGAMQGMFNAKPDLVITIDNTLLVCEAKLIEKFDEEQLTRTRNIAEVWAMLLYKDLGFLEPPTYSVFKLGAKNYSPDINWTSILEITTQTYNEYDRTRIAITAGVELLKRLQHE